MTKEELLRNFALYDIILDCKVGDGHNYEDLLLRAGLKNGDEEVIHIKMDDELLEYINDKEITDAFDKIDKWYA